MGRHSSANHSPSSRRHRSHRSISPPPREKQRHSSRGPVRSGSGSPDPPRRSRSRSPSPRTKRLKKGQPEREVREGSGRGKGSERDAVERKERNRAENIDDDSGRNGRSSRSRHERSPERHRNGRSRHRSQSPQHHASSANAKPRDEVSGDIQP